MSLSRCFVRGFRICASQYQQSTKADWLNRTQYFNNTVRDLVADVMAKGEVAKTPSLEKRLVKLMEYDTLLRIPLQGHMTMMAYEVLENPKNLNEQNLYKAQVVSCAMELAQSYFLIMDDFEDQSETRHGQPCWHLLPEVKNLILNDACMFRSLVNDILKAHLNDPVYTKMIDIFNEVCKHFVINGSCIGKLQKPKIYIK
ncbi:PREDICTED: farnesyl pyrophosphate synthase 1-like [Papilio polytes]|uniref:farnesyl pyrophosphate synthase 1-like n=1 Tax=Papilio polytes TaxID=76194 RepID=UPI000676999E|nr:PREDICTED: farnesyl pyrophosphate synthase 1-like [Papilio polytes]